MKITLLSKGLKKCRKCGLEKTLDRFQSARRICRTCRYEMAKTQEWYLRPRRRQSTAYILKRDLKRLYGITPETYHQLLATQNNLCAICGNPPTTKRLAVDHDHVTNTVRGLLCGGCNQGLGSFRDDPRLLAKATAYLEASRCLVQV